MKASDWIFKMGLLIIAIAFVSVYFLSSQNGRYQYKTNPGEVYETIFDTKTGIIHRLSLYGKTFAHFDLVNNKYKFDEGGVGVIKKEVPNTLHLAGFIV